MAELVLSLRDRELSRVPITHTRVTLGRDATCDVVIDNAGVSRNHAVIVFLDDQFQLRDLDSQNGVTVNGKAIKEAVLKYGDVIGIGKFTLRLAETDDEIELAAGTKQKPSAPRSVMSTVQLDATAMNALREQIAAQQKAKRPNQAEARAPQAQPEEGNAQRQAAPKRAPAKPQPRRPQQPERPAAPLPPAKPPSSANSSGVLKLVALGVAAFGLLAWVAFWLLQRPL
jgi:hypothetical protein